MSRKQIGAIDAELLAAVDERAQFLGQTRRVFVERTLQARLASADFKLNGEVHEAGQPVYVDLARSARQPGPNVENIRSSTQAKQDTGPRPKKGK